MIPREDYHRAGVGDRKTSGPVCPFSKGREVRMDRKKPSDAQEKAGNRRGAAKLDPGRDRADSPQPQARTPTGAPHARGESPVARAVYPAPRMRTKLRRP